MTNHVDALHLRKTWGRGLWRAPTPWGNGWQMVSRDGMGSIIADAGIWEDGLLWLHASVSHRIEMPSYEDMKRLHQSVWKGTGYSYEVHPPDSEHVNIHQNARHLWGRADGKPALPEFGRFGTV